MSVDWPLWALLFPLGILILLSSLDDLFLDIYFVAHFAARFATHWMRRKGQPAAGTGAASIETRTEKRIAIFVPLWHEADVIVGMVEHNTSAIRYRNYEFFIGAYPNDERTMDAVRDLESRYERVHLAVCPHDGPTSKADCLNWIYQNMLLHEEKQGTTFDVVVTHDAEDLIHPEALDCINRESERNGMVQIPVLPLPTPLPSWVHGVYCDEFAEWQLKDMPMRAAMGSFVPSNGVGTGYTRKALDQLATADHNLIFEPGCLTEDYENGLRLHHLGVPQTFVLLGGAVTREYFPRTLHSAIRQRTRWVTGIALQSWARHGWRGGRAQKYWFWRDRKGLLGNPIGLLANLLFVLGLVYWAAGRSITGQPAIGRQIFWITSGLQLERLAVRFFCSTRLYGITFALGVPVRAFVANYINALSSLRAVWVYANARLRGRPLVWLKTEHAYPSRNALAGHRRRLGEVLTGSGYISAETLASALRNQPKGMRLGEFLLSRGEITEQELYEALSLQQSVPAGELAPDRVDAPVTRILPRWVVRDWKILPYQISSGNLFLASPEVPSDEMTRAVRAFTRLSLRFYLVTPANFESLVRHWL